MNKKTTYAVVAVVVLAVIAVVAFNMNKTGAPVGGSPVAQSPMSMKDLLAKGGSQKCTFANTAAGTESSGVIYLASGRMRGDFTDKASGGQVVESHMIVDGQTTYIWGNQMPQGVKMSSDATTAQGGQTGSGFDVDQALNYKCESWSANQGQFSLPSGITFMDLSAALPGVGATVPPGGTGGVSAQCAQCELIPDASGKAQCRAALSCN
jgi:hypothetical protein